MNRLLYLFSFSFPKDTYIGLGRDGLEISCSHPGGIILTGSTSTLGFFHHVDPVLRE